MLQFATFLLDAMLDRSLSNPSLARWLDWVKRFFCHVSFANGWSTVRVRAHNVH
jgi:hypothetical protein